MFNATSGCSPYFTPQPPRPPPLFAGLASQNLAAEVKIRAERGGGELLINDPDFGRGKKKRTLRDFDLEDTQSSRWQAIARIPEEEFERYIAETTRNPRVNPPVNYPVNPPAVYEAFGNEVNYAQLIKVYKATRPDHGRYSPADCVGCRKEYVIGAADPDHISTSIIERSNLTVRMSMRRFTRLTNGHSKKVENHGHAFALFTMHYNWCRQHSTIGTSPAVKAGLADHVWTLEELIGLLA